MEKLTIKKVNEAEIDIISKVVNVHLESFKGFFLTFLGSGFLKQMYLAYTEHEQSDILVAMDGDNVVGFLAYSEHMSGLYKFMLKRRVLQFAWYSLGAFLRKPQVFMRLIRAFLKPSEAQKDEDYVKIASIGVSSKAKATGIGSSLIDVLKNEVDFNKFKYICLETDAIDNEPVNKFYIKNGFYIVKEFETQEGRKMYEYRYEDKKQV